MKLSDFNYTLPNELIARYPTEERSASRLMYLDRETGAIKHYQFSELLQLLNPGDLLVFNNSRVIPARLFGRKETGGQLEILVERLLDCQTCLAHIRASRSPKAGSQIILSDGTALEVVGRADALFHLRLLSSGSLLDVLYRLGHMPLPPYIDRDDEAFDQERYQTVYAKPEGSVAAPTAGLHFDEPLIDALEKRGINTAFLTLHVGAGTFQPVRVENILEHHMHAEWVIVPEQLCQQVRETKAAGGRVIAVGTTTVRSLETAAQSGELKSFEGDTDIFIYPGYDFKVIDGMITNFHLPESTLLMLISAFAGRENVLAAYQTAIEMHYRFYSYGDAMIIL